MALIKYKLGDLIEQRREKYNGIEELPIFGVSREGFISPKQDGADTSIYNVFYKDDFVFNPARMELNSIALNSDYPKAICSSLYEVFYVKRTDIVLPEYLNMFIKRDEFARKCWFEAIGSARNYFRVSNLSEFEIELPSIEIQKQYINVFYSVIKNLKSYECGLDDLKYTTEAYIQYLDNCEYDKLGKYIEKNKKRNQSEIYGKEDVRGFNNDGEFIRPVRLFSGKISTFKILGKEDFVYNSRINSTINKLSIAFNEDKELIVSPAYESFYVSNKEKLDPYYLYMLLQRESFARKVLFNSFGSSTIVFGLDALNEIEIPIPDISIQKSIAKLYKTYKARKAIYDRMKIQVQNISSILLKGSLDAGRKED